MGRDWWRFKLFAEKAALWANSRAEFEACLRAFCATERALSPKFSEAEFLSKAEEKWEAGHSKAGAE